MPQNQAQWLQTGPNMPAVEPSSVELPQKRGLPIAVWFVLAVLVGFGVVASHHALEGLSARHITRCYTRAAMFRHVQRRLKTRRHVGS